MPPKLLRSYKNRFPFSLGAPSYIYPGDYILNIKRLGPYLDEIELLFFESLPKNSLPSPENFREMARLSAELDLAYNVHLPIDVSISDPDPEMRGLAVEKLIHAMGPASLLDPTAMILHVDYKEENFSEKCVGKWKERIEGSLESLLSTGINGEKIAIETLDYPFEIIEDIVFDHGLSVCLDFGHLILHGRDIEKVFDKYAKRVSMIHLHGVKDGEDHLGLDACAEKEVMSKFFRILKRFSGSVSLEVFSYERLEKSLEALEAGWAD